MPSTISNHVLKAQGVLLVRLVPVIGLTILFFGCYGDQEAKNQSADQAEQLQLGIEEKHSEHSTDADRDFIPPDVNLKDTSAGNPLLPEINPPGLSDSIEQEVSEIHPFPLPDSWKRIGKHEIWIDFNAKQVILGGIICLNKGLLEMFACPMGTKEHESVVAVLAPAIEMHSALLAVGAVPGKPARWEEDRGYIPPSGSVIDIQVRWLEDKTETIITRDSRQMVRNSLTEEAMDHDWIFGGSVIFDDPETGERFYYANSGEMICVSNFPSAAIDVGFESSSDNNNLMFQAFSENIPEIGTKVYLILTPGAYREGD
jgi:hypothetical protein